MNCKLRYHQYVNSYFVCRDHLERKQGILKEIQNTHKADACKVLKPKKQFNFSADNVFMKLSVPEVQCFY